MVIRFGLYMLVCAALIACGNGFKNTDTGLEYKFLIQNSGVKKPQLGEVMYLDYQVQNSEGDYIYQTSVSKKGLPDVISLEMPKYKGDYFEALSMMSLGDSATFLINADSFFYYHLQSNVPPDIKSGTKLVLTIRLLDILSIDQSEERKNQEKLAQYNAEYDAMESFIAKHKLVVKTTEEGIKYKIDKFNSNSRIAVGDIVLMNYKGSLLNGTEFISTYAVNQPQEFEMGKEYEIDFYNMVLPLLGEKEKGTFIIPFVYAFAEKGVKEKVPPFATVVYEIEILKVTKKRTK